MITSQEQEFEDQGFVFIESFQTPAQVDEINNNLGRFIAEVLPGLPDEHVFYENKSAPETLKQIQRMQDYDGFFNKLMADGPFRQLAEKLLGSEVTCQNMQYFNKPPKVGQATPAHQDGYYFKLEPCEAITMWMALEPVDEENGCVRYLPRSHKLGLRSHAKTGTLGFSQGITDFPTTDDSSHEIAFPANAGDLLAHHALTIHRADENRSPTRTRRALGFIYYSVNAKQDVAAWTRYQSELNCNLKLQGKI